MTEDHLHFRGRYEYADSVSLERALALARVELDEEELADAGAWLRDFVCRGTHLTVDATVPASAEHRFAAANVFSILAQHAIDGSVAALEGAREVDRFVAGIDD